MAPRWDGAYSTIDERTAAMTPPGRPHVPRAFNWAALGAPPLLAPAHSQSRITSHHAFTHAPHFSSLAKERVQTRGNRNERRHRALVASLVRSTAPAIVDPFFSFLEEEEKEEEGSEGKG